MAFGLVAVGACAGCGSSEVPSRSRHSTSDPESFSGTLHVVGEGAVPPDPAEWALVTWPELAAVRHQVLPPEAFGPVLWTMELVPEGPLEARWYAVRWSGTPRENVSIAGIPLADGSVVGRVFGEPRPEVAQVIGHDAEGAITVRFNMDVSPGPGETLDAMVRVEQGAARCELDFRGGDEAIRSDAYFTCVPPLDFSAPVAVHTEGAVSTDGVGPPSAPWDYVRTLPEPGIDGLRVVTIPSMLVAPPVPPALCDGVACAE